MLLVVGFFKASYSLETQDLYPEHDGGYYTNVAQNVRDGNGFTTNISLYHKAYSHFPHQTSVYLLWPLLHGHVARVFPIMKVGVWLPTLFYFSTLILAYLWAQRVFPGPLLRGSPWLCAGHVLVLMLALHQPFFRYTSLPYTEGLAYTLLFAALWRTWPGWTQPGPWRGIELGMWLGVLLLARGQFVLVAMAAFGALSLALTLPDRRARRLAMLLGAVGAFGVIAFAYWQHLASFVANPGWSSLFRFDQNRESDLLSPIPTLVQVNSVYGYLADRASGFLVAFWPSGFHSYARSYHVFHYALLVALPLLALDGALWVGATRRRRAWLWARSTSSTAWVFVVLLAAGGFLSIHTLHKQYSREWNFSLRQGLSCVFLFFLALVYLLRHRRRLVVALGLCLTLGGSALGVASLAHTIRELKKADPGDVGRGPWRPGLARWLVERQREHGELTVAISHYWPERLALSTPGVNYHWVYWNTTRDDLELMFRVLGVRYLLVQKGATPRLRFLRPGQVFLARFREVCNDLDGFRVFVLRDPGSRWHPSSPSDPRQ
ncbi:MAG: hypothetical protein LJF30_23700 [Acidobacteria bacterium]|nr:hypothetical protein [Acidobacteriota bacterium]